MSEQKEKRYKLTGGVRGERPPIYCTKATLAAELDAGESTIDDWVRKGILPDPIELPTGGLRWHWPEIEESLARFGKRGKTIDPYTEGLIHVQKAKHGNTDTS